MFRKLMLAGLMTATILGGVAPAYAQRGDGRRSEGRAEQARPQGNHNMRGNWNQAQQRPAPQRQMRVQPQVRAQPDVRAQGDQRRRQGQPAPQQRVTPPQQGDNRVWDRGERARENRQDWRQDTREDRRDWRQDQRQDRRNDRQDWRQDRRDDRRDEWRRDQARRYSDRDRWNNQRRWDNRWRAERRYDWNSYRNQYRERYRLGRYYAPRGWDYGYRRFSIGFFLSNMLYSNNYWINDPYYYRLPPAYGTLRWVRYYDDALLVDIRDGYVVDVIHNFFW